MVDDLVEVELASQAYRHDGSIVPWSTPTSTEQTILALATAPRGAACPLDSTCTYFLAQTPGDDTISATGPSGVLCDQHGANCAAVTAVARHFRLHVVAG